MIVTSTPLLLDTTSNQYMGAAKSLEGKLSILLSKDLMQRRESFPLESRASLLLPGSF